MIPGGQQSQECRRDCTHAAGGDECRLSIFQCRELLVYGDMIRGVVESNVFEAVIISLIVVFEIGRLKNRYADRALNSRLWFSCMNQVRFDTGETPRHDVSPNLKGASLLLAFAVVDE